MLKNFTYHAIEQLKSRMIELNDETALDKIIGNCTSDTAILAQKALVKKANDGSNGENIILIVRSKKVITVMLRRDNQPFEPNPLHVKATYNNLTGEWNKI